ncbi:GNAT family N-acetyltransferase [Longimicrobium sp.]|uniref:GNAT family N-acetyltransferase n=1 Tax=Longimicrobium sp. TaxID=2029185 RepID=UPI002E346C8B|nr:GNAT family N-acetyltransferase [Longimicrobium sp.]HEX6038918.1 GNAT family N-acetyltransferase [Longimicrobium sp.]
MTTRLLPATEWARLDGCGLQIAPLVPPGDAEVVVVEDGGRIVGCFTVVRVTYLESVWIAPELRGNAGIVRSLYQRAFKLAAKWGRWALGGAEDSNPAMGDYLERLGAKPIPAKFYAVPLEGGH